MADFTLRTSCLTAILLTTLNSNKKTNMTNISRCKDSVCARLYAVECAGPFSEYALTRPPKGPASWHLTNVYSIWVRFSYIRRRRKNGWNKGKEVSGVFWPDWLHCTGEGKAGQKLWGNKWAKKLKYWRWGWGWAMLACIPSLLGRRHPDVADEARYGSSSTAFGLVPRSNIRLKSVVRSENTTVGQVAWEDRICTSWRIRSPQNKNDKSGCSILVRSF